MPYRVINTEYSGSTGSGNVVTMQQLVTGMLITLLLVAVTLIMVRSLKLFLFRHPRNEHETKKQIRN